MDTGYENVLPHFPRLWTVDTGYENVLPHFLVGHRDAHVILHLIACG